MSFPDLDGLPIVDGHCHPLLADPWQISPETFRDLFTEGRPRTMADHVSHTAYYRRAIRALARSLGCEATPAAVLARRATDGPSTAERLLRRERVTALLVDTGYPPEAMPLPEMRRAMPCDIHEVFRLETSAERLLGQALPYREFLDRFRQGLRAAARRCVALKSIIAYRSGLAIRPWPAHEVEESYRAALARVREGGSPRLVDRPLLDTLFHEALSLATEAGCPLQVHTGFGDPDIDLLQANPLLLRPLLEDRRWADVRMVLLHLAYPYFREAAFMAAVWPQVFVDLSLASAFMGPGTIGPLVEVLSLAPATKLLYGSDVGALPELFAFVAQWTRDALAEALGWLRDRGELTDEEARVAAGRILGENARALYRLPVGASAA